MKPRDDREFARLPEEIMLAIDRLCNRFEQSRRSGKPMRVETLLKELETKYRRAGLAELLPLEIEYRNRAGQEATIDELTKRFPTVQKEWLQSLLAATSQATTYSASPQPASAKLPDVLGDYRILSPLGGGGMGAVYRAVLERMGRKVALKVLKPEIQNNEALRQRFDREVQAAARLSHLNVVTALDARGHESVHFLVTELVEGSDLNHHVRQRGPLNAPQAVDVLQQAAKGLAYAHTQGVIHRDIKPASLLLSSDGAAKILDMGLARLESDDADRKESGLTDTGVVMDTAAYMPPEQARDTRRANARSDIYRLGCTLHFLLTERTVYAGVSQVDTILSHVNQPVPSLRQIDSRVPAPLDTLFQTMIAKDPDARIQTAKEVSDRLSQLREQGMSASDSARLRNLIAQMSTVTPGKKQTQAPTEFQFAEKSRSRTAPRSVKSSHSKSMLIGSLATVVLLGIVFLLWWNRGDNGVQAEPDPLNGGQEKKLVQKNEPPKNSDIDGSSEDRPREEQFTGWRFNGSSSYLAVPDLTPEPEASYRIERIARAERYQTSNPVSWLGPNWMVIFMSETGELGMARQVTDVPDVRASSQVLARDNWSHIAATFDGAQMQLFINGRLVARQTMNLEIGETSGGLFIGDVDSRLLPFGQNQRFFPGQIFCARVSLGVRYHAEFTAPGQLPGDKDTIVVLEPVAGSEPSLCNAAGQPIRSTAIDVQR